MKVSIVIPCYNAAPFIWECISSVMKQDYDDIEIIIVDDCSTDKSVEVIEKLQRLYSGIKLIRNSINLGECKTSDIGFKSARGKYVCRLSADDMFVNKDHISKQIEVMEKTNADWCYNNINLIGESINKATVCNTAWTPTPIRYSANLFYILDNIFLKFPHICYLIAGVRNPINSSALMFRASTMLSWDSDLRSVCDGTLLAKMFLVGHKGRAIHSMGAFYRIHPDQATGKDPTNKIHMVVKQRIYNNSSLPTWMKICSYFIRRIYDLR
jgi:glycosyltransferase involved in cell wall biosynthesis